MTRTLRLTTIEHAVRIGTRLVYSWFRGHAEAVGKLTPRFYRRYRGPLIQSFREGLEMEIIEGFKRDSRAIATETLPAQDDTLGWLYLMQHYEAPTRLLDWTENVLAALFFAVRDDRAWRSDGELWAMLPWALNRAAGLAYGTPLEGRSAVLAYFAEEPYATDREALAQHVADQLGYLVSEEWRQDPKPFNRPVAFEPRRDFPRMLVQSSVFTIHPEPTTGNTIPEVLKDDRYLVRYLIPATAKQRLWRDLRALGITDRALFPDFEGLSRTIAPLRQVDITYSPPDPPRCGGVVEPDEDGTGSGQDSASEASNETP